MIKFIVQSADLCSQLTILFYFPFEEPLGGGGLFGKTLRRQDVGIPPLVRGGCEIAKLHEALVDQSVQNVVGTPHTDSDCLSQFTLRHFRIVSKKAKDTEVRILLKPAALAGHLWDTFFLRLRSRLRRTPGPESDTDESGRWIANQVIVQD